MRREVWLVLLTFLWVVGGLAALIRSEAPRGRVVGKVVAAESGQALADVAVWFEHPRGSWRIVSKQDGSFELPNLPAGTYTVHAYAYAHRLEPTKVTLQEGETKSLLLALEPVAPFLELVHPQSVFYSAKRSRSVFVASCRRRSCGCKCGKSDGNLPVPNKSP